MATNVKILLDKRRSKKDGTFPLVLRVLHNRKSANISLGYYLLEKDWDDKNERLKRSAQLISNHTRFHALLNSKKTAALNIITRLEENGLIHSMSMTEIKSVIQQKEQTQQQTTVFKYLDKVIEDLKEAKRQGTARSYKGLKNKLQLVNNNKDLTFQQIDYKFLVKFEKKHYAGGSGAGSLSVYMRTLRALVNKAIKENIVSKEHYAFSHYTIKRSEPQRRALNQDVFTVIKELPLEEGSALKKARDFYLASYYMQGMNWMDMCLLRMKNISGDFQRINYIRHKTGKPFSIKIFPPLQKLLSKYTKSDFDEDDFVFPILRKDLPVERYPTFIMNKRKKLNKQLKEIAGLCDIPAFTIYSARHTYATLLGAVSKALVMLRQHLQICHA